MTTLLVGSGRPPGHSRVTISPATSRLSLRGTYGSSCNLNLRSSNGGLSRILDVRRNAHDREVPASKNQGPNAGSAPKRVLLHEPRRFVSAMKLVSGARPRLLN